MEATKERRAPVDEVSCLLWFSDGSYACGYWVGGLGKWSCCGDLHTPSKVKAWSTLAECKSAPDLLAACERFVRRAECTCEGGGPGFVCDVCEGKAALAKAKGGAR